MERLLDVYKRQASVLISTHMIDSVEDYWDVANIMMNGRFAATKFNDGSAVSYTHLDVYKRQVLYPASRISTRQPQRVQRNTAP